MKVRLKKDASDDITNYEAINEILSNTKDRSYRNNDGDCRKLAKLACFLFMFSDTIKQHLSSDENHHNFLSHCWLQEKRELQVKVDNLYTIAKKRNI